MQVGRVDVPAEVDKTGSVTVVEYSSGIEVRCRGRVFHLEDVFMPYFAFHVGDLKRLLNQDLLYLTPFALVSGSSAVLRYDCLLSLVFLGVCFDVQKRNRHREYIFVSS